MIFETKTVRLKTGENATFRSPVPETDAAAVAAFIKDCAAETDFIVRTPEECDELAAGEENFLRAVNASDDSVMILCETDGEIAGNCQITLMNRQKIRHRADIAIGLRQKFWGRGIGTALMTELVGIARANGVEQLELEVIEGNTRAMGLYRKMGFTFAWERPDMIRSKSGAPRKLYGMIRRLDETPAADYDGLCEALDAVLDGCAHLTANLANASALLWEALPALNWAGFYVMEDGKLVLGPFQGKTACVEIEVGHGVCGTAVAQDATQVVPNVHEFPGHIPCDGASNAEIVVPIRKDGAVWGVLDIDSPVFDRFTPEDKTGLEKFVKILEKNI